MKINGYMVIHSHKMVMNPFPRINLIASLALCVRYFKNDTVDFKEVEILLQESIETFLGFFCKCSINHRI